MSYDDTITLVQDHWYALLHPDSDMETIVLRKVRDDRQIAQYGTSDAISVWNVGSGDYTIVPTLY